MCNYSVSQLFCKKYFFQRRKVGKFEVAGCRCTITAGRIPSAEYEAGICTAAQSTLKNQRHAAFSEDKQGLNFKYYLSKVYTHRIPMLAVRVVD